MIAQEFYNPWPYDQALAWMLKAHDRVQRNPNYLIIGAGSHAETVITMGRKQDQTSLDPGRLAAWPDALIRQTDRGGAVVAHEPGQIVLYPVIKLRAHNFSVSALVHMLESTMISFLASGGINATGRTFGPGVYIEKAKVGFIGLRVREGISTHGLALNVYNEGAVFSAIDPCGSPGLAVTSFYKHQPSEKPLDYHIRSLSDIFINQLCSYAPRFHPKN